MPPPLFRLFSGIVLFHIILRMTVILSKCNNHKLRHIIFKIPGKLWPQLRMIPYLVPCRFHTYVIRLMKPSCSIEQRHPSLCDIMYLRVQLSGCHPCIRIPAIRIFPVVLRIFAACIRYGFRYFPRRDRVPIYFDFPSRFIRHIQKACPVRNLHTQETDLMAGILPLKYRQFMFFFICLFYRNLQNSRTVFRQQERRLPPVQNTAQIIVPVRPPVLYMQFQHISRKPHTYAGTWKYKSRLFSAAPVNPPHIR